MEYEIFRTLTRTAAAAIVVSATASLVEGQAPAAPAFTSRQALDGKAAYARSCASCHMPDLSGANEMPALKGTTFMAAWGARSTKELFDYMSSAMPYSAPPLRTEEYLAIEAFILEANGAPAGADPLTPETSVRIDRLPSPAALKEATER